MSLVHITHYTDEADSGGTGAACGGVSDNIEMVSADRCRQRPASNLTGGSRSGRRPSVLAANALALMALRDISFTVHEGEGV
ncbi:ATP-binding cassette domain-containing protein [Mycolicibacterium aubagnense]